MKKLLLVAILMLALVFTVVACNDDPVDQPDTTDGDTTVEAPTEQPTEEPTDEPTEEQTTVADEPTAEETTVGEEPTVEETTEEETTEEVTTEEVTTADPAAPVLVIDDETINTIAQSTVNTEAQQIGSTELLTEGNISFVRLTAVGQGDPYIAIVPLNSSYTLPNYMVIRYRTNSETNGEFFMGSGAGWTGAGDSFSVDWNQDGEWNLMIVDLSTTGLTSITDGKVTYTRFDFFAGKSAEGDYLDVEYIAFFNTAEYAQAYDIEIHKAPMWDVDKSVVTHLSFDELDKLAAGAKVDGVFTPGQAAGWDNTVNLSDFSVDTLRFWGWVGLKGTIGQFGYQINGGKAIYDDAWTVAAGDDVKNAASGTGADDASRMEIMISLAGLDGTTTVNVLYKNAEGVEVCLKEFTVNLPVLPKDITDTFTSDVASNEEGTDLQQSDLANYFTVQYGAGGNHTVTEGLYSYGDINEMYKDMNGLYAYIIDMTSSTNATYAFVRGAHAVNSVDLPAQQDALYVINNYYETDGLGKMGGAGIYASIYDGKVEIVVKVYDDATLNHIGNKIYTVEVTGTKLTMADDGNTVYIMVDDQLCATIALSGATSYEKLSLVQPELMFAQTAVVTLADGTTETLENTLVASTYASQIGLAIRGGLMKFASIQVLGFSEVEIPVEEPETSTTIPAELLTVWGDGTMEGYAFDVQFSADTTNLYLDLVVTDPTPETVGMAQLCIIKDGAQNWITISKEGTTADLGATVVMTAAEDGKISYEITVPLAGIYGEYELPLTTSVFVAYINDDIANVGIGTTNNLEAPNWDALQGCELVLNADGSADLTLPAAPEA